MACRAAVKGFVICGAIAGVASLAAVTTISICKISKYKKSFKHHFDKVPPIFDENNSSLLRECDEKKLIHSITDWHNKSEICGLIKIGDGNFVKIVRITSKMHNPITGSLNYNPFLCIIPKLFTRDECRHIVEVSMSKKWKSSKRHLIHDDFIINTWLKCGGHKDFMSQQSLGINELDDSSIKEMILNRLICLFPEALTSVHKESSGGVTPNIASYATISIFLKRYIDDGGIKLHTDTDPYTLIIYLTDVEEGGETIFPNADVAFKPTCGTAICFYTRIPHLLEKVMSKDKPLITDGSVPCQYALHGSMPVKRGVKYIIQIQLTPKNF